jgi:hypothetical protein
MGSRRGGCRDRDVDETTYALRFAAELGAWQLLDGPATQHLVGDTRAAILAAVQLAPGAGPRRIADAAGLEHDTVRQTVRRMVDAGQLDTMAMSATSPSRQSQLSQVFPLSLARARHDPRYLRRLRRP